MSKASITLTLFCFALAGAAHAQTVAVPGDQPTIQDGINAVPDGGSVLVAPGVYLEQNIDFQGKNIRVIGTGGAAVTIVDAQGLGRGFLFQNGETERAWLRGFTIQNAISPAGTAGAAGIAGAPDGGPGDPGGDGGHGGAILIDGASPHISLCSFRQNDTGPGGAGGPGGAAAAGGIGGAGGKGGNGGHGAGIAILNGSPFIEACIFFGNLPGDGGIGGTGAPGASPVSEGDGTAGGAGGNGGDGGNGAAIAVLGGSPKIVSCLVNFSTTGRGGNGGIGGAGSPATAGVSPHAGGTGGAGGNGGNGGTGTAIYVASGSPLISNQTLISNTTRLGGTGGNGGLGGAGSDGGGTGATGATGTAGAQGACGGVAAAGGTTELMNSIVRSNTPTQLAGALTVSYSNVQGGFAGTGIIDANPLFASGSDFHLTAFSPGIDAGNNDPILTQVLTSTPPSLSVSTGGPLDFFVKSDQLTIDLDGNNRFDDDGNTPDTGVGAGRPNDFGAYEFSSQPLPDTKYWVVGSLSGTSPGFVLSHLVVPLNPDPYFLITVKDANHIGPFGGFIDTLASLDVFGEGTPTIVLPAGLALAGFTVYHAFGIFDFVSGPQAVSNPVSTLLVP